VELEPENPTVLRGIERVKGDIILAKNLIVQLDFTFN